MFVVGSDMNEIKSLKQQFDMKELGPGKWMIAMQIKKDKWTERLQSS